MGNQLFNYACGYAVARHDNDTLMLDTSECDNSTLRKFELDQFHLKYDKRESFPNGTVFQKLYKRLRRDLKYRVIKERGMYGTKDGHYRPDDMDMRIYEKKRLRNKYLYGYWQYLPYYKEYLDEILEMMTPAYEQSEAVVRFVEEFQTTPTCAVHVRGGDIVGPGAEFFGKALVRMEKEKPGVRFLVFTNDMERAKEALPEEKVTYIGELGDFSDMDEFFLMAACQNQIISNSTFSTWAAYLNSNPEKTVIMPDYDLAECMKLPEWIVL